MRTWVAQVSMSWIIRNAHLGGVGEHELDHLLRARLRLFQEQLDRRSDQLQLHCRGFFRERLRGPAIVTRSQPADK